MFEKSKNKQKRGRGWRIKKTFTNEHKKMRDDHTHTEMKIRMDNGYEQL